MSEPSKLAQEIAKQIGRELEAATLKSLRTGEGLGLSRPERDALIATIIVRLTDPLEKSRDEHVRSVLRAAEQIGELETRLAALKAAARTADHAFRRYWEESMYLDELAEAMGKLRATMEKVEVTNG